MYKASYYFEYLLTFLAGKEDWGRKGDITIAISTDDFFTPKSFCEKFKHKVAHVKLPI